MLRHINLSLKRNMAKKRDKALGKCPHCKKAVHARVKEANKFRRDVCECPKCEQRVLSAVGLDVTIMRWAASITTMLCASARNGVTGAAKELAKTAGKRPL